MPNIPFTHRVSIVSKTDHYFPLINRIMNHHLVGLHHVTATVHDAQEDLDFYRDMLGMRLVKKTVNFDNHDVYHFYYGTEMGTPGTIMTTFPYKGHNVRQGVKGTGQVVATAFSVPSGSKDYWEQRIKTAGVNVVEAGTRFGEWVLAFDDPSGLAIELIGNDLDSRSIWEGGDVDPVHAIKGIHSVTLSLKDAAPSRALLEDMLGWQLSGEEENRMRFSTDAKGPGKQLDFLIEPNRERGLNGIGTVHHVALAISSDPEQLKLRTNLVEKGFKVTEVKDRNYFHSIYFREPGGVLYEVATIPPGFSVDESPETLGTDLKLPEWEEPNRSQIEQMLAKIK